MKLTILGIGNATVTECYNTCFILSEGERHFLVDAGGGNQILKKLKDQNIPLEEIHDIFLTHEHIDHLLGMIWLIRMIGQKMNQGKYEGTARIYCHEGLVSVLETIAGLTIQKKVTKHIGERILLIPVKDGEEREIIGCKVTFSTSAPPRRSSSVSPSFCRTGRNSPAAGTSLIIPVRKLM